MKKLLLAVVTLAALGGVSSAAQAGYCTCYGSQNIYDLIYYDTDGGRNLIYTYFNYYDCQAALARTPLCTGR